MPRKALYLAIALAISSFLIPRAVLAGAPGFDFRRTVWGMSKEAVKKAEAGRPDRETADRLSYRGTVENLQCEIHYFFHGDRLIQAQYQIVERIDQEFCLIDEKCPVEDLYLTDFVKLKEGLRRDYGEPVARYEDWKNRLYLDDLNRWGVAIRLGDLAIGYRWETPRTSIELKIFGGDNKMNILLTYMQRLIS